MKFIPSRDLRIRPGEVWKKLRKERELIVTSNGKPVALMMPVKEDDFEESLHALRGARAKAAMRKIQERAAANNLSITTDEIDKIIRKARQERRK